MIRVRAHDDGRFAVKDGTRSWMVVDGHYAVWCDEDWVQNDGWRELVVTTDLRPAPSVSPTEEKRDA